MGEFITNWGITLPDVKGDVMVAWLGPEGMVPRQYVLLPNLGVELRCEDVPGRSFGHDAYATLRRLAWQYRAARNAELAALLLNAMQMIGERVKKRPDVEAADVDRVIECLKTDRCGCERCRYGV